MSIGVVLNGARCMLSDIGSVLDGLLPSRLPIREYGSLEFLFAPDRSSASLIRPSGALVPRRRGKPAFPHEGRPSFGEEGL